MAKKCGTISGSHVPTHPMCWYTAYDGTIVTNRGRMIAAISDAMISLSPGIVNRDKP